MLFVPNEAGGEIGETVVVAWKDTVEAVRAISSAAPFLETAKHVRLISIAEDETAAAMMGYFSATGLPVTFESAPFGARDIGDALLTGTGAGVLLVMGGYGRWPGANGFSGAPRSMYCRTDGECPDQC